MKTMLRTLKAGQKINIGNWTLYAYDNGTITARQDDGHMAPSQNPTLTNLRRLLVWIDAGNNL